MDCPKNSSNKLRNKALTPAKSLLLVVDNNNNTDLKLAKPQVRRCSNLNKNSILKPNPKPNLQECFRPKTPPKRSKLKEATEFNKKARSVLAKTSPTLNKKCNQERKWVWAMTNWSKWFKTRSREEELAVSCNSVVSSEFGMTRVINFSNLMRHQKHSLSLELALKALSLSKRSVSLIETVAVLSTTKNSLELFVAPWIPSESRLLVALSIKWIKTAVVFLNSVTLRAFIMRVNILMLFKVRRRRMRSCLSSLILLRLITRLMLMIVEMGVWAKLSGSNTTIMFRCQSMMTVTSK